jgi:hypothetical protein
MFKMFCSQVTDEERQQIAQHFLLSSPPGQFHEVLAGTYLAVTQIAHINYAFTVDVRKLLPDGLIGEPLAAGIARAFNTKTNKVVTTPGGAKVNLNTTCEMCVFLFAY